MELPRFSDKQIIGSLMFIGYFGIGAAGAFVPGMTVEGRALTRDMLVVVGPLLGIIVNKTWQYDKTDHANAVTLNEAVNKLPPNITTQTTTTKSITEEPPVDGPSQMPPPPEPLLPPIMRNQP